MSRILPFILFLMLCVSLPAQTPGRKVRYMTYDEARPILQTLDEILPAELKGKPPESQAAVWDGWVKAQDVMVRARLRRGDEDTLINFLLFGASFTKQPRITPAELARLKQAQKADAGGETLDARIDDLIRGLAAPGANERLIFLRRLVAHLGHRTATIDGRTKLRQYLIAGLLRVLNEQESYARAIESARLQGGASEEFIERSKLYRSRGLSLDTTLSPNFAIEESLKAMKAGGLLAPGGVRKVAVIGPGLDFTDKAAGYDFYPEQTIQPFALVDSLLRLGLADAGALRLTAFDISPRVLDHLNRAKRRVGYTVQLPHDPNAKWKPEWLSFWKNFGDRIGKPAPAAAVPAGLGDLKLRAVKINPAAVKMIVPADLNIVYQRMSQPENFDLMVASTFLGYYELVDHTLALSNIESMLRPGGSLLSSNALLELPVVKMKSVGYQTVVYSERNDDGDHVVWYQRIE